MKKILLLILIILFTGCSSNNVTYQQIDNDKFNHIITNNNPYTIIDVRTFSEYQEGHIENAINIPVDGITSDTVKNINLDEIIIVYCRSGNRSKQAALKLIDLGYTNVFDYGAITNYEGNIIKETNN